MGVTWVMVMEKINMMILYRYVETTSPTENSNRNEQEKIRMLKRFVFRAAYFSMEVVVIDLSCKSGNINGSK